MQYSARCEEIEAVLLAPLQAVLGDVGKLLRLEVDPERMDDELMAAVAGRGSSVPPSFAGEVPNKAASSAESPFADRGDAPLHGRFAGNMERDVATMPSDSRHAASHEYAASAAVLGTLPIASASQPSDSTESPSAPRLSAPAALPQVEPNVVTKAPPAQTGRAVEHAESPSGVASLKRRGTEATPPLPMRRDADSHAPFAVRASADAGRSPGETSSAASAGTPSAVAENGVTDVLREHEQGRGMPLVARATSPQQAHPVGPHPAPLAAPSLSHQAAIAGATAAAPGPSLHVPSTVRYPETRAITSSRGIPLRPVAHAEVSGPQAQSAAAPSRDLRLKADRLAGAMEPCLDRAYQATVASLADGAPMQEPGTVRNTFNVSIAMGEKGGAESTDRTALEELMTEILCEAARRHGLEV